jgi:hypothetical protein
MTLELDSLNTFLYKIKCKRENKIEKLVHIGEEKILQNVNRVTLPQSIWAYFNVLK